jgi:hypothetical protein
MKTIILLAILSLPAGILAQNALLNTAVYTSNASPSNNPKADSSSRYVVDGNNPASIKITRNADAFSFPQKRELSVYPNPAIADTKAVFSSNNNGAKYTLALYTADGKPLWQKTGLTVKGTNTVVFNVTNLATGNYYLQLFAENRKAITGLIKLK